MALKIFCLKIVRKLFRRILPDKYFIKLSYYIQTGEKVNLEQPRNFNEKIQWAKLYDRRQIYTQLVDKFEVRRFVEEKAGNDILIPLIGVWNSFDEMDFDSLPEKFVLKTTHDSGGVWICKDKKKFNINKARKQINRHLKKNFFWHFREWAYKNVTPRIIAEKYMEDESGFELKDYKIFTYDGKAYFIQVDFGRFSEHRRNFYDAEWNFLDFSLLYPNAPDIQIPKPDNLAELIDAAEKLGKGFPHVRVDLYSIYGKAFFGELTFYHGAGTERFKPAFWNVKLGEHWRLPQKKGD